MSVDVTLDMLESPLSYPYTGAPKRAQNRKFGTDKM